MRRKQRAQEAGLTLFLPIRLGELGDIKNLELRNVDAIPLPIKPGDEITFRVVEVTREVVER